MIVCLCLRSRLLVDVFVSVHSAEKETEPRAFAADMQQLDFSAWQDKQTERRDDGRAAPGSARAADAHLKMTLEVWEWKLNETYRGHAENLSLICHHADKWCGLCKVYLQVF